MNPGKTAPTSTQGNIKSLSVLSAVTDRKAVWIISCTSLLLVALVTITAIHLTEDRLRRNAVADLAGELDVLVNNVDRLRHLPVAIALHPHVITALETLNGESGNLSPAENCAEAAVCQPQLIASINEYLHTVSETADASLLYIIDAEGYVRATSNWRRDDTLLGGYYRFRPYFKNAIKGSEARYFAVGISTGEAGYYFAQPVHTQQTREIIGIAVAKLELESLQSQWLGKQPHRLLIDEEGVVILSSHEPWRFRSTRALSAQQHRNFRAERKYANHELQLIDVQGEITDGKVRIDDQLFISSTVDLPFQGWQLVQLTAITPVYKAGLIAATVSALLASLGAAVFLYLRERRRKNALSIAAKDAARMRTLNMQLQAQITERKKAEQDLANAQSELIQASRLAALGKMSAAIAHEVNQPLSAIRTFSASAALLLERNRPDDVKKNLDEIQALTQRLAILTYDLKTFARKSNVPRESVSLSSCVDTVSSTLTAELEKHGISLQISTPDPTIRVRGNAIRIQQVLSNLLRNAIDATSDIERCGEIRLSVTREDEQATIRVEDNGHGLEKSDLEHAFDPFFTTKPLGKGVGLGLSIAYGIVEEMGGQFKVQNSNEGGALFSVRLPCDEKSNAA